MCADPKFPQTNEKIREYNDASLAMIRREFDGTISILDAEKMSHREDMHADNIHMVPSYYRQVAAILENWVRSDA